MELDALILSVVSNVVTVRLGLKAMAPAGALMSMNAVLTTVAVIRW
jgi:hypothetical protein